jgi:hypothetical protein
VVQLIEKRGAERKLVTIEAEIVSGKNRYKGRIENISLDRLYMRFGLYIQFATALDVNLNDFLPTNKVIIKFKIPSGEEFELECESMWINIHQMPPHSMVNQLGIQSIDPPEKLKEFVKTLPSVDIGT